MDFNGNCILTAHIMSVAGHCIPMTEEQEQWQLPLRCTEENLQEEKTTTRKDGKQGKWKAKVQRKKFIIMNS